MRPGVLVLLERWADLPAFVVGPDRDVLAGTPLAARVNPAWSPGHNLVGFTFLDPRARQVYPDWEDIARQAVSGLRATAAARPAAGLDAFVARLRERSGTFRALWDSHDVADRWRAGNGSRSRASAYSGSTTRPSPSPDPRGRCCTCTSRGPAARTTRRCGASRPASDDQSAFSHGVTPSLPVVPRSRCGVTVTGVAPSFARTRT
ncbi:hypothetical protein GCM10010238_17650 [Streptomyces griseoviridis]|uniref:MmyB-like transcription regulator ligand binding domain-containing protein n=1 Tax=Streptomyces griseoviridis TaxID=45398 RepID=A0A918LBK6_STRGD|nr:hypothetical protein GCM10010238_17650 [Streptomyces niveoruber]